MNLDIGIPRNKERKANLSRDFPYCLKGVLDQSGPFLSILKNTTFLKNYLLLSINLQNLNRFFFILASSKIKHDGHFKSLLKIIFL